MKPFVSVRHGSVLPALAILAGVAALEPARADDPQRAAQPPSLQDGTYHVGPPELFEHAGNRKRVLITTTVCRREGKLEHLMSRTKAEKQHESILTSDLDARHIHAALLAAGAEPGNPVQFVNDKGEREFKAPKGDKI